MRTKFRSDRGQTAGFVAISIVALIAMTAFVLDVGSWFRADRQLQSVADAAALAGAQELPIDPAKAIAVANDYAADNGGPTAESIGIENDLSANDTISVVYSSSVPGFFAKILGISAVTVRASAKARAAALGSARWVAPIVVDEKHPKLQCKPVPCWDEPTELTYLNLKTSGSPTGAGNFGFVNLSGDVGIGNAELGNWILNGYDEMIGTGNYDANTGNAFSSTQIEDALTARKGDTLLFPVYRTLISSGTNARYVIVDWVGFVVTGFDFKSGERKIFGHFTKVAWEGLPSKTGGAGLGARVVSLTR